MPKHSTLTGAELHFPLGRASEGALTLQDDLAYAYQILHGSNNQLNVSTITGEEKISIGNTTTNPTILSPGSGSVGIGTLAPTSPNGNQVAVQVTGTSVGIVLDSTNGAGVPWEIQHNSSDMKIIYDGADTLGGGAKTAIALDAEGAMRLGAEVSTPSDPGSGNGGFVYVKSDGFLYYRSNTKTETELSSPGASSQTVTTENSTPIAITLANKNSTVLVDTVAIGGASAISIDKTPAQFGSGATLSFKDSTGDANASNIVITTAFAGTIDASNTLTITADFGRATLISDGSNWFIVSGDGYSLS